MAYSRVPSRAVERGKKPRDVLEEVEQQWIYTEEELTRTPSICDGMSVDEERTLRYKGYNFMSQAGIMLKLPQTTILCATVFFNRFLMRYSLKEEKPKGAKKLHHYVRWSLKQQAAPARKLTIHSKQIAATALFLATKVEEHCRKIRELVIACCRVAQKNANLIVDENTKDYWRWRDTIIHNEDVLLEQLCFDLSIESPYNVLFDLLQFYGVEKQRKLRDSAWSFVNDTNLTQACLLFTSRTIASAALYCGAKHTQIAFSDDREGRPWWEVQRVSLKDVRRCCNYMADFYSSQGQKGGALKPGDRSIYEGLKSPLENDADGHGTRLRRASHTSVPMERSGSEMSSTGKRPREEDTQMQNGNGASQDTSNGHPAPTLSNTQESIDAGVKRVKLDNGDAAVPVSQPKENGTSAGATQDSMMVDDGGSEEDTIANSEKGEIRDDEEEKKTERKRSGKNKGVKRRERDKKRAEIYKKKRRA